GQWANSFLQLRALYLPSPDYPLLLPASVAQGWTYAGSQTVLIPAALAMLFTFATVGVLGATLHVLKSRRQGLLGAFALLSVPWFVELGAWQYADVPLAFFVLTALALICLYDHGAAEHPGWLVLAGLAAGRAAWTTTEGVGFGVALLVARAVMVASTRGWAVFVRQLGYLAIGLLPMLAILAVFKLEFGVITDLIAGQGRHATPARLADWSRYAEIAQVTAGELV